MSRPNRQSQKNDEVDFHNKKLKNDTHASTTGSDARLFKKSKGTAAKLSHMGHVTIKNRNGFFVNVLKSHISQQAGEILVKVTSMENIINNLVKDFLVLPNYRSFWWFKSKVRK